MEETVEVVQIDTGEVDAIRTRFPLRAHRRDDLYETRWKG